MKKISINVKIHAEVIDDDEGDTYVKKDSESVNDFFDCNRYVEDMVLDGVKNDILKVSDVTDVLLLYEDSKTEAPLVIVASVEDSIDDEVVKEAIIMLINNLAIDHGAYQLYFEVI